MKNNHIVNPFNYIGSKERMLEQINDNFYWNAKYLVDPFCGGNAIPINFGKHFEKIVANDFCWQLIEIHKSFQKYPIKTILSEIDDMINTFNIGKMNKEEFIELRNYYNTFHSKQYNFNPVMLYILITHAFNYQIEFSKDNRYIVPSGYNRSHFNKNLRQKLEIYVNALKEVNIEFSAYNFNDLFDYILAGEACLSEYFFFIDPPYLSSSKSCYRLYGSRWNEDNEKQLYDRLDEIHGLGGKFLLTNVLTKGDNHNIILEEWKNKYTTVIIDNTYNNCNYQRRDVKDVEIMIRNY